MDKCLTGLEVVKLKKAKTFPFFSLISFQSIYAFASVERALKPAFTYSKSTIRMAEQYEKSNQG